MRTFTMFAVALATCLSVLCGAPASAQQIAAGPSGGETQFFLDYVKKNERWVKQERDGQCLHGQFDRMNNIDKMRGPCSIDATTAEQLQSGRITLKFTATLQQDYKQYPNSTLEVACRYNDAVWIKDGISTDPHRGMLCMVVNAILPGAHDTARWKSMGFYLVRKNSALVYYPMTGLRIQFVERQETIRRGFMPAGL